MTDSDLAARDLPRPSDADGLAPAAPRAKRSRLVLGELIGLPVAVAAWVFAMERVYERSYRPPQLPPADFPITKLWPDIRQEDLSAGWEVLSTEVVGIGAGVLAFVIVVTFFCVSHRVPLSARWVAVTAVALWVVGAILLGLELEADMVRLTRQAGG